MYEVLEITVINYAIRCYVKTALCFIWTHDKHGDSSWRRVVCEEIEKKSSAHQNYRLPPSWNENCLWDGDKSDCIQNFTTFPS